MRPGQRPGAAPPRPGPCKRPGPKEGIPGSRGRSSAGRSAWSWATLPCDGARNRRSGVPCRFRPGWGSSKGPSSRRHRASGPAERAGRRSLRRRQWAHRRGRRSWRSRRPGPTGCRAQGRCRPWPEADPSPWSSPARKGRTRERSGAGRPGFLYYEALLSTSGIRSGLQAPAVEVPQDERAG